MISTTKIKGTCEVSTVCFGTWRLLDRNTPSQAEALLSEAINRGINFFDTAQVYAGGDCERLLSSLKQDYPKVCISTKIPGKTFPGNEIHPEEVYPKGYIRESIEVSADNLGTDSIDLLHLHNWDFEWGPKDVERILEELTDSKEEGLCKLVGISLPKWPRKISTNLGEVPMDFLQVPYSLAQQRYLTFLENLGGKGPEILARW